jgi:hypothetical protein
MYKGIEKDMKDLERRQIMLERRRELFARAVSVYEKWRALPGEICRALQFVTLSLALVGGFLGAITDAGGPSTPG